MRVKNDTLVEEVELKVAADVIALAVLAPNSMA